MRRINATIDFSSIEFSAEGKIITEPSHYPAKKFETPIRQIVSSPASSDFTKGTFLYFDKRRFVTQSRNRGGSPDIFINVTIIAIPANVQAEQEDGIYRGRGD
jgi:hypothetical protein